MSELLENNFFVLPSDWLIVCVDDLVKENILEKPLDGNHGGIHPKGSDFVSRGIPFVMASDINQSKIDLQYCKYISLEQANSLNKGFSIAGDVLLTHKASLGRTAIVGNISFPFIMLTPQVTYYRVVNKQALNNLYLKYFFDSPFFQQTLINFGDSGSTRAYVGITAQKGLPIILPPLPEQKAIANVLSSLDDKIDLLHRQNKTLEAMAETLFRQWFIEEAQEDWEEIKIKDFDVIVTDFVANGSFASLKDNVTLVNDREDYALFIRNTDLKSNFSTKVFVTEKSYNFLKKTRLFGNEVIISSVGDVGSVFRCPSFKIPMTLGNNLIVLKSEFNLFFYLFFNSDYGQNLIYGITSGSVQEKFNKTAFRDLYVSYPNLEYIVDFEKLVCPYFKKLDFNKSQIQTLEKLRDNLLPKLMSGEIRVAYDQHDAA